MGRLASVVLAVWCMNSACGQTEDGGMQAIDECGVLTRGSDGCVVFDAAGGSYVVPDSGRFNVGDMVRIVGTVDPACITICSNADGCIRGAVLYDPTAFPCGEPLPQFPGDLLTGICAAVGASLPTLAAVGMWCTHPRRRNGALDSR